MAAGFWIFVYVVAAPVLALFALGYGGLRVVQALTTPAFEGTLRLERVDVRAQSGYMTGAGEFHLWLTDREVTLRVRPGYKYSSETSGTKRIALDRIERVEPLPGHAVRLILKGGEERGWTFEFPDEGSRRRWLAAFPRLPHVTAGVER